MTVLHALWLPILLSSVFVFIVSAFIHMALPWHKGDYRKVPEEGKVQEALRPFSIPPGDYMLPHCPSADMKSPEFTERLSKGPVVILTVGPNGQMNMGKSLGLWFLYVLVISFLTGYVACHALPVGAVCAKVCGIVGVTSFLAYAAALWPISIWFRRSWCTTIKSTVDGLIYAAVTAATFDWLWPR